MTPTDEQLYGLELYKTKKPIMFNSLAGTGKTTMAKLIDKQNRSRRTILYLTFAKRNCDEALAEQKAGEFSETTEIYTINGAGHRVWGTTASSRLGVDKQKTSSILRTVIESLSSKGEKDEAWEDFSLIISSVGRAKHLGYIPNKVDSRYERLIEPDAFFAGLEETPSEFAQELINEVLKISIKTAFLGNIDFDDQIYMPTLFGGTFPEYDDIIGDEWQDFSPINHEMLSRYIDKGARPIAIGDPWQSIYAFRGAVQEGMSKTKARYDMTEADLSVSFRCPSEIVKAAHWRVPHLKWSKVGGEAISLPNLSMGDIPDDAAIICRNNAPLYSLALCLLRSGRGVNVAGSELGPKLIRIMNKFGPETMKRVQVFEAIEHWLGQKLAAQSTTASDMADCMRVFASFGKTLGQATGYAEYLFQQGGAITLTTGHKAKGLEWEKVYHLDPFLIRVDKEEQEKNLKYVITTRSKDRLHEIESKDITP